MNVVLQFFSGLFGRVNTSEMGDSLPDEVTALVLQQLAPLTWVETCSFVCRKWNRLVNMPIWWENIAKHYNVAFSFKANEKVTIAFKKQIYFLLNLEPPLETKEALFSTIRTICSYMTSDQVVGIHYTSDSQPNAYFKAFMVKISSSNINYFFSSFIEMEKQAIRIYQIRGKNKADCGCGNDHIYDTSWSRSDDWRDVQIKQCGILNPSKIGDEIFNALT